MLVVSIIVITQKNHYLIKLNQCFSEAGLSIVYGAWLLFYALKDSNVPIKAKATIVGALGYFISPHRLNSRYPIPDAGYGDDLTAITTALGIIYIFITPEIKIKAKEKTKEWLIM